MVSIKHKVTIKAKTAQEETPVAVESPVVTLKRKQPEVAKDTDKSGQNKVTPTPGSEKNHNTGKIVGGIAAMAAILAGVYFFGMKNDGKIDDNVGIPQTEQIAQAIETAESEVKPQTDVTEEVSNKEDEDVNNVPESGASDESNESPVTIGNEEATVKPESDDNPSTKTSGNASSLTKAVGNNQPRKNDATTTNIAATSASIGSDVIENAKRVIRGDFGNGQERKDKLGAAYAEIQAKVNEMYKNGLVF